jgi:hypothetical protein
MDSFIERAQRLHFWFYNEFQRNTSCKLQPQLTKFYQILEYWKCMHYWNSLDGSFFYVLASYFEIVENEHLTIGI